MEHSVGMALGVLTGLGAGLLFVAVLGKRKVLDMTFDERQERARGKAFQYGFFTLAAAVMAYGILELLVGRWCDALMGGTLCVCLGLTVFAAVCIRRDAYLSLHERPKAVMGLLAALSAVNLLLGARYLIDGTLIQGGVLTFRACNLLAGVTLLAVLLLYIAKRCADRRGEAE